MLTEMLVAYRLYGSGGEGGGMPGGMPGGAPDGAGDDDGGAGPTFDEVKNANAPLCLSICSLPPPPLPFFLPAHLLSVSFSDARPGSHAGGLMVLLRPWPTQALEMPILSSVRLLPDRMCVCYRMSGCQQTFCINY